VNISKPVGWVAASAALGLVLTACSSAGGSTGPVANGSPIATARTASATPAPATTAQVAPPKVAAGDVSTAAHPVADGRSLAALPGSSNPSTPSGPQHTGSSLPPLSGPVTYQSVNVPSTYNCAEAGTTYYTPPNIAIGFDVTVLVSSPTLANDLVIAAPNRAPRGLSNASHLVRATALGNGVWQATYRTFASLSEPRFTPVTVSALQATAGGSHYTIAFPSSFTITKDDCHS